MRRGYALWVIAWEWVGTVLLAILLGRHAWHVWRSNELTPVLEFPIGWVYAATTLLIALAAILAALQGPAPVHGAGEESK